MKFLALSALFGASAVGATSFDDHVDACWRQVYGRGVGKPIHTCKPDEEQSGLLCYPPCNDGYKGVGPVCWEQCRDGYKDIGLLCTNKNKLFDLYAKKSYGRGVGAPLGCSVDEEYDAGLCYDQCHDNYDGVGPLCWELCPAWAPHTFGAMCCDDVGSCFDAVGDVALRVLVGTETREEANGQLGFVIPLCDEVECDAADGFPLAKPLQSSSKPCDPGYTGHKTRTCGTDGNWDEEDDSACVRITCPESAGWPTGLSGDTSVLECGPQHTGQKSRACELDGDWSEVDATGCELIVCPGFGPFPSAVAGGVAEAPCLHNFDGLQTITCLPSGEWSDVDDSECESD